jgi:hypothetical protein
MILSSLKAGFAQVRANMRMVVVFYAANLFFGLLLMLPLRAIVKNFIGDSTMGLKLGGSLDMDFLFELVKNNSQLFSTFGALMLIVPACNWLFMLFLSGGALTIFSGDEKYAPALFWGSAAKYFGRFCRLALWSLSVFALLFCVQYLESGAQRLIFGKDPYQNITYWGGWISVGLRAMILLFCGMILDYARIHAVLTDEQKMRISLMQGIRFVLGNFLQTFGLALLLLIVGAITLVIYNPLADSFAAPKAFIVLLLFLVQQVYMFFRMMLRLTSYASQLDLYRQLAAEPVTVTSVSNGDLTIEGLGTAT